MEGNTIEGGMTRVIDLATFQKLYHDEEGEGLVNWTSKQRDAREEQFVSGSRYCNYINL